jgi:VWFA-related protein
VNARRNFAIFVAELFALAISAQRTSARQIPAQQLAVSTQSIDSEIHLDVVVTTKSGSAVTGLSKQDFTILDNKAPQTIGSFQAVDGTQPTEVVIVIDAVNAPYRAVSYERAQIDRFLRADGGDLSYPTSILVLTDTGLQSVEDFSKDGNQLASGLDRYTVSARFLNHAGFYGAAEKFQISLEAMHELAIRDASRPGRKLFLWISPGWPLLSGPAVQLDDKERRQLFSDIVDISTILRRGRITVYNINPAGMFGSLARDTYWESFVKGVGKPNQAQMGNLGLQVLATQSGGAVYSFDNDITALLEKCVAESRAYYEISFKPTADTRPNQYHNLEVRVAKHGLGARTSKGYYSVPQSQFRRPTISPPA